MTDCFPLPRDTARHDLIATVRVLLEMLMPMGEASLGSVARALGMHPRTLQRRLHAHGLSLSDLLDQQRRDLAERIVLERRMSLTELALTLGYSEQSAFNHAFERWFGEAPRRWAARHGEGQGPPRVIPASRIAREGGIDVYR
ncbi:helix-turn-helix transcriptional regulator [Novosphingobium sp.]|jgi:AraC-like DNA-binding protein|uniref:helix-turn-helix transcriptional regulator n=1 Tax=Novosphingobium sp. TaxID=1874826 RepID=UPI0022C900DE|nr:helix-turn-helix transcriptional regulator [Novosphingobium sp.]MCZ8018562.1 helix-turn-helix transcriptional regulator [Novosphingobium sp.]MCZ8036023.1 helix-turn-helix transcriptional regulator [Novosphingobium sp.]MCZ8050311.1 helix-turn-helix transcriptional regulator [Novosphingobium sp.]MCZ8060900.1 helix-turn-helix transcriptional regulator [Novosphingobium sp.]MCZ8233147.1 helix-turn-helix transcriptional regulator [Novosphingobium sp.]